jgi:hypothetical protein
MSRLGVAAGVASHGCLLLGMHRPKPQLVSLRSLFSWHAHPHGCLLLREGKEVAACRQGGWWWNTRPPVMVVVGHGGGLFEGHRRTRRKEEKQTRKGLCLAVPASTNERREGAVNSGWSESNWSGEGGGLRWLVGTRRR